MKPSCEVRKRLKIIVSLGGLAIGLFWLSQHDLTYIFSREPKAEGLPLSYWLDHWYIHFQYPPFAKENTEAQAAVRSMGTKAVPDLIKTLEKVSVISPSIEALLAIGAPAAPALANKLTETLPDTNPPTLFHRRSENKARAAEVQLRVLGILSAMGTNATAAVPVLIRAVQSSNWWTQAEAAAALASVGSNRPESAIPALLQALQNPDDHGMAQGNIALALGSIGQYRPNMVIPSLTKVFTNQTTHEWNLATTAMALVWAGKDRPNTVVPVLARVLTNFSATTNVPLAPPREFNLWADMDMLGWIALYHQWISPLHSFNAAIAAPGPGIVDALATLGGDARQAVPDLVLAGQGQNAEMRERVSVALVAIAPETPDKLAPLIRNLAEKDAIIKQHALQALQTLGTNAADALSAIHKCLHDPNAEVRTQAILCITSIGMLLDETTIQTISDMALTPNENVAQAAVGTLANLANRSKPALVGLEKARAMGKAPHVRDMARSGLEMMMVSGETNALIGCLQDTNAEVQFRALQIMWEFGQHLPIPTETVPALNSVLQDGPPESHFFASNMMFQINNKNFGDQMPNGR